MDCDSPGNFDKRENEVTIEMDDDVMNYRCEIELDVEFWPVEHPVEPEDEDRPVKCPFPISSSVINDEKTTEEMREIRPDLGKERPETAPLPRPIRVVRKRHHAFAGGNNSAAKPTVPRVSSPLQPRHSSDESGVTIYKVLQQTD